MWLGRVAPVSAAPPGRSVVGEGLLGASHLALRVVACGNAFSLSLESNLGRSFSSFPVRNGMWL